MLLGLVAADEWLLPLVVDDEADDGVDELLFSFGLFALLLLPLTPLTELSLLCLNAP